MFPEQRLHTLKKIVEERKSVDIATLCKELGVSDVTVRKYLDKLEEEGFLKKLHGGAMLVQQEEDPYDAEGYDLTLEKEHMAELAATLVEEGDSIFLAHGSSCYALARQLHKLGNLSVITNNANAMTELAMYVRRLYFLGGEIMTQDGLIYSYGKKALAQMGGTFVQKAFISVSGIDLMAGVTVNDLEQLEIINAVMNMSKEVIIIADSSKFNKVGLHRVCHISDIKIYISDKKLEDKYKEYFFNNDIKILTAYDIK